MARKPRTDHAGAWHHVGNRGVDRKQVFSDDYDRHTFLSIMSDTFGDLETELHAYCLMGNHYHLITHTPMASLSQSMQQLSSRYTVAYNKRHKRDGPLFTSRFWSRLLDTDAYVLEASRYVHRNAIDLGSHQPLSSYQWSSYGAYAGRVRRPRWLRVDQVLGFGGLSARQYETYVEACRPTDSTGSAIGPRARELAVCSDQAARTLENTRYDELCSGLTIALAAEVFELTSTEIGANLSVSSASVRGRLRRFRSQRDTDPALAALASQAAERLAPSALAPNP